MPQPPSRQPGDTEPTPPTSTTLWFMLLALLSAFALSQAYRTVTAIMATGLRHDFGLAPASLGAFAGLFGLSFGVTQFFMGIGMDVVLSLIHISEPTRPY